ncbi:MAG: hypothetical protein H6Q89_2481 [Myxococcaceae bacterium]|nr:hypothetical protein [Myxococcaceae bacterium]
MPTAFPLLSLLALGLVSAAPRQPSFRTGDVVLQTSRSAMSLPIQEATSSRWSHTGLIEVTAKGVFVVEAVQPVSRTPWAHWRARGEGGAVKVLRLKQLDPQAATRSLEWATGMIGRPYDARFGWGDEALYCSELVVKALEHGSGVRVGHFDRLDALKLSKASRALALERAVPLSTEVVTPAALEQDPRFEVVYP